MFLCSPLEKELLMAFESSCQAIWGSKEIHRRPFFCRGSGMYTEK